MKLRTGRKNGRNIYIQLGDEPHDTDPQVGCIDTSILADAMVQTFNRYYPDDVQDIWLGNHIAVFDLDWERQRPVG